MWWLVPAGILALGVVAWRRHPHHRHSGGGMRVRDEYRWRRTPQDNLTAEDKRPHHSGPEEYDGD
jgi:hypothetical protein